MEGFKSKYTGREIEKKLDKIDITNFIGKFVNNSDKYNWYCKLNNKTSVLLNVNPETKEFKEVIDLKIDEELTDFSYLFYNIKYLEKSKIFDISNITDLTCMFNECSRLTTVDLSNFDTSKVTSMFCMFYNCSRLTTVDLSNFDTSKVTSMYCMFSGCSKLTTLDLSSFNTSNVTDMSSMFYNCSSLTTLDLSNFDTSKVNTMYCMFENCSSLTTLDLSNFDTSKVTSFNRMFSNCSSLTTLDLSSFDISNINSIDWLFASCSKLTYIKCKQAFKDWCIQNQYTIKLPDALKEGGSGTWDIVDAA